ncbi:MAG TPA: hypothetical protein VJ901_08145 [Thermoanaerobaculia bacterium]|nr:hypothetical protein [Thermoanaerobaculia bacterium]
MRLKLLVFALAIAQFVHAQTTIQNIYSVVKKRDNGAAEGSAYSFTQKNALPADWLLQTPNIWGVRVSDVKTVPLCGGPGCEPNFRLPYCDSAKCVAGTCQTLRAAGDKQLCAGPADQIVDQIYDVVAKGGTLVDIASLGNPNDRFMAALRNAVTATAKSGKKVYVRVLLGAPTGEPVDVDRLRNQLISDARGIRGSKLHLFVMADRRMNLTWNHAKIIANDTTAIVGGHNLWTNDYLLKNLVHDVSMKVEGPAVTAAHKYVDRFWTALCPTTKTASYDGETNTISHGCRAFPKAFEAPDAGSVPVLAVGNYAKLLPDGPSNYMSDVARNEAIRQAKKTVRMSQQDIGFQLGPIKRWPDETLKALGQALIDNVEIWFVLSNFGSKGGDNGYQWGIPPFVTLNMIAQAAKARPGAPPGNQLVEKLCKNLHFASLRFNKQDDAWATGAAFANHAKSWIVDDKTLYIGSDNVYPAYLQEYGYIVENDAAAKAFLDTYWNKLWQASERTAISGGAPGSTCGLRCEMGSSPRLDPGYSNKPHGFADVNGDGKADYCRAIGKDRLACAIATPSGFDDGAFGSSEHFRFGDFGTLTDVNLDQKADYCRVTSVDVISCALSTGEAGNSRGRFEDGKFADSVKIDRGYNDQHRAFIDVNGDGRADFCRMVSDPDRISCLLATATGWNGGVLESAARFDFGYWDRPKFFVDIEGKGKGSYCRGVDNPMWMKCATSDGTRFVDGSYSTMTNFDFGSEPRGFADVNGDGYLDFCRFRGDKLECAMNFRGSFNDGKWTAKLAAGSEPRGFYDVNGDGKADYCRVVNGKFQCAISTGENVDGTFKEGFEPLDGFLIGYAPFRFAHVFSDKGMAYCRMVNGAGMVCTNLPVCHK